MEGAVSFHLPGIDGHPHAEGLLEDVAKPRLIPLSLNPA